MPSFHKVLVSVNTERGERTIREKLPKVIAPGGVADLVTIVEPFPWYSRLLGSAADLASKMVEDARVRLEPLAGSLREQGLNVDARVLQGKRSLELTRAVLDGRHDLLLKEADDDRPGLLGTADVRVIRSCPAPAWVFRPTDAPCRVLAAVNPRAEGDGEHYDPFGLSGRFEPPAIQDPSRENALNRRILDLAAWAASMFGGSVHAVHVWRVPGEDRLRQNPHVNTDEVDQYVETIRSESAARFQALIDDFEKAGPAVVRHLEKGWTAESIASLIAREQITLLVMGSVVRTGITGYVIGNTAESLLGRVDCSVLAIKPEGFVSPVATDQGPAEAEAG